MESFCQFFIRHGHLVIRIEHYFPNNASHYQTLVYEEYDKNRLAYALGCHSDEELLKYLTKHYTKGCDILDVLSDNNIIFSIEGTGYEDSSSDI